MDEICAREGFFLNPDKLPLTKLYLPYKVTNCKVKDVIDLDKMLSLVSTQTKKDYWRGRYSLETAKKPALDSCWIQDKKYAEFQPYYPQLSEKENHLFMNKNEKFLEVLKYFAECTYHQFWCYVAFEPRISQIITNFLQHSVPLYSTQYLAEEYLNLYSTVCSYVRIIYSRLLKFQLSETEYVEEQDAIKILKRTSLFSGDSVLCLCYIYNSSNPGFIKDLMNFCTSSNYEDIYVKELEQLFTNILEEYDKLERDNLRLDASADVTNYSYRVPELFDPIWLEEFSLFLLEMSTGLHELMNVCERSIAIAFEMQLPFRISFVYEKKYAELYDYFEHNKGVPYDWTRYKELIDRWLALGRSKLIGLFHDFISHCFVNIMLLRNKRQEQEVFLEKYLGLISSAMEHHLFVRDYNKSHSIESQFLVLAKNVTDFDKDQTDYLLNCLKMTLTKSKTQTKPVEESCIDKTVSTLFKEEVNEIIPQNEYQSIYDVLHRYLQNQNSIGDESDDIPNPVAMAIQQYYELKQQWEHDPESIKILKKPDNEEIECQIRVVAEMLPHLGTGFILRCLEEMNYNPEDVIMNVLNEDLPYNLIEIPRDLPRDSLVEFGPGPSTARPKFVPHVGKKDRYVNANDMLNDKQEKQNIKDFVLRSSYNYDLYDDDYDERNDLYYHSDNSDVESKALCHLVDRDVPKYNVISDPSSSSECEDTPAKPKDAFCEDPAVVRARREARFGRTHNGTHRDVAGKPKGQGQDKNVQQNRDKKNVQKSSKANHNRKKNSQWKHSRGMLPC